jgi:hypothetical protein
MVYRCFIPRSVELSSSSGRSWHTLVKSFDQFTYRNFFVLSSKIASCPIIYKVIQS